MTGNGYGIVFSSSEVADPRRQNVFLILTQQSQVVPIAVYAHRNI